MRTSQHFKDDQMNEHTQSTLAIAKWNEVFENSNSRKLKRMEWVPMPTDLIGSTGYNLMLDEFESDAPAMYGTWSALVAIASQCNVRGTLADGQGNPLKISHLSRKSGFPAESFERLINWATTKEVSWLVSTENDDPPPISHQSPTKPGDLSSDFPAGREKLRATRQDSTEQGITKQETTTTDKTEKGAGERRSSVVDRIDSEFEERVLTHARAIGRIPRMAKMIAAGSLAKPLVWQACWVAELIDPGIVPELVRSLGIKSGQGYVGRPQSWLRIAMTKACEERGKNWHNLLEQVGLMPEPEVVS